MDYKIDYEIEKKYYIYIKMTSHRCIKNDYTNIKMTTIFKKITSKYIK